MIDDWRQSWFEGTGGQTHRQFPFGFVQVFLIRNIIQELRWYVHRTNMRIFQNDFFIFPPKNLYIKKQCLLIYFSRYLDPAESEVSFSGLEPSCHVLLPANHSKEERRGNPLKCLALEVANLPAYRHTITLMLNVKQGS